MSLLLGKPLSLDTTCGIPLLGFEHRQVPYCMTTFPQSTPFSCDPHPDAQAKARLPVSSDVSGTRAPPNATPSNSRQKKQPALSRHVLTSGRGNPTGTSSRLALRTLRHRALDYERTYQRQIADGRPDESWTACGSARCTKCTYYDRMNMYYHKPQKATAWREDLFITAMLEVLGSAGGGGLDPKEDPVSRRDLDSFIQSPPIRGAFWEFHTTCGVSPQEVAPAAMAAKLTGIKPAVVRIAQAASIGELKLGRCASNVDEQRHAAGEHQGGLAILRKGGRRAGGGGGGEARGMRVRTTARRDGETALDDVHLCFAHHLVKRPRAWDLGDYVLQFCVVAESWRRYGLQRGCNWGFGGGAETVADLLCAVLLNWWTMTAYDCFEKHKHTRLSINLVWDEWMAGYPPFLQGGDEMEMEEEQQQEQGSGSDEVLHGVGRAVML